MEAAGSSHLCVEAACEFLPKVDISRHRRSTAVGSPALRPGLIEEYSWTVLKSLKKCMVNVTDYMGATWFWRLLLTARTELEHRCHDSFSFSL